MLKVSYTLTFTHSLYLFLKLGAALLIGPVESDHCSVPSQSLETVRVQVVR